MNRLKVAVVHPRLGAGGSEARAVWTLQALRAGFDVSLISCGPVNLDRLNALYGTTLAPTDFRHRRVPLPPGITGHRFTALQGHILQRYCRRVAAEFDVMISTYNPMSLGVPAIQCIADFSFVPELLLTINPVYQEHGNWWYGDSILRRSYLGLCNLVSRTDSDAFKHDLIVANSEWSRDLMRQKFGLESRLLYPAVVGDFPEVPFAQRDNGFVCMGRAVATKRMDAVIRILGKVREKGHDIHLHILSDIDDSPYARELKMLADERHDWVFLEGLTFGDAKRDLLVRHRYGINGCLNEAFGISVAEMVRAGCLVFVPNGGGQGEIVNHPNLIYENDDDAVNKIDAVLRDRQMGDGLAQHLRVWAQKFSTHAFAQGMLAITREFVERKDRAEAQRLQVASSSQPYREP